MRYEKMSTAELRAVARRDGIKDCDKMSKEELLCKLWDMDEYSGGYCTVTELRDEARSKGLSGYSEMRKAELIELLENDFYDNYERYYRTWYPSMDSQGNPIDNKKCYVMDSQGNYYDNYEMYLAAHPSDDNDSIGSLIDDDDDDGIGSLIDDEG